MYRTESQQVTAPLSSRRVWTRAWQSVTPNVRNLGMTSMLTDISSEMVVSVLPAYLVLQLGLSPLAFGAVDGLYHGVTAVTRWVSGMVADRWRRHKEVAAAGYALSALSRLALLAAGRAWTGIAFAIASDRLGKGIRTAPRDALISLSTSQSTLGYAFGVHRALDATGAMLGPVIAFGVLGLIPGAYDVVFVTSFCFAVVGLGVLVLFVENKASETGGETRRISMRMAIGVLHARDFRLVVMSASGLALVTVSDAFIYLMLQERVQFSGGVFPLLYVGTSLSFLLLAVPVGFLADRLGRSRIFLLGHLVLVILYATLLVPTNTIVAVVFSVVCLGTYYAATDGVIVALGSSMLPSAVRGSGLALLTTATSLSRLVASVTVGWIWTMWGKEAAIAGFASAMIVALLFAAMPLGRRHWSTDAA